MCGLAKYEEASAKTSYNQPYVYIINYFITRRLYNILSITIINNLKIVILNIYITFNLVIIVIYLSL